MEKTRLPGFWQKKKRGGAVLLQQRRPAGHHISEELEDGLPCLGMAGASRIIRDARSWERVFFLVSLSTPPSRSCVYLHGLLSLRCAACQFMLMVRWWCAEWLSEVKLPPPPSSSCPSAPPPPQSCLPYPPSSPFPSPPQIPPKSPLSLSGTLCGLLAFTPDGSEGGSSWDCVTWTLWWFWRKETDLEGGGAPNRSKQDAKTAGRQKKGGRRFCGCQKDG